LIFLKENKIGAYSGEKDKISSAPKNLAVDSLRSLFSNISFWIILFYFAVSSLPGWGVKNWLPTLFSQSLQLDMSVAGPLCTISIAISLLFGVIIGGILSDKWVQRNLSGRIYLSSIGLGLTIPALILIGYGHSLITVLCAAIFLDLVLECLMVIICRLYVSLFLQNTDQLHMAL